MLAFFAAGIGGWAGWALGDPVSPFVAVLLSAVGTGLGLWGARRLTEELF
jgi:hypothetical protein